MSDTNEIHDKENELELYGDDRISSYDAKIPKFLIWSYIVLPIWGIVSFMLFWNGSFGWFDRGYWQQLQIAANTTFPTENQDSPQNDKIKPAEQ